MEALIPADSPMIQPVHGAALVAGRKPMEIRRFKQIATFGRVLDVVRNKRSRPDATYCEHCEGEIIDFTLGEPLFPAIRTTSQSYGESKVEFLGRETVESNVKCGGLFRSASFPPENWGSPRGLKVSKSSRTGTASRWKGKCVCATRAASSGDVDIETSASSPCTSPGASTDREVDIRKSVSSLFPPVQIASEEIREVEMGRVEDREKPITLWSNNKMVEEEILVSKCSYSGASLNLKSSPSEVMSTKGCVTNGRCPPHGKLSVVGRRREMEDAVAVVPYFLSLPCDVISGCSNRLTKSQSVSVLHFFGVYDGHGGTQASTFCKERLHLALAEEVTKIASVVDSGNIINVKNWKYLWETAMIASFLKLDREVGGVCPNGKCSDVSSSSTCCTDTIAPGTVGSTAVVAVVTSCQIIIGNCGDSRAVLSRAGRAIALSRDQKPEREDERNRIEAAGGRVVNWDGYRVGGLLAMSRAIGDRYLKPYVIAEPEVTCIEREEEDDCLILATDGLWDVISNDMACEVACKFLNTARKKLNPKFVSPTDVDAPTTAVAALLTKLALARGSTDNISVVVIDLSYR